MNDNPIVVDYRTGSADLLPLLQTRRLPVRMDKMLFGDISFMGNGAEGPVPIGIEVKQTSDILKCITDGRFSGHQLPGLVQTYQYTWLVVEGAWRCDRATGVLQVPRRGGWVDVKLGSRMFMYKELDNFLRTCELKGGIRVWRTYDRQETAQFIEDLWKWWTAKEWADHRSHLAFDSSGTCDAALLVRPNLVRKIAKELPGIGWGKSRAVANHFGNVLAMVSADEAEWEGIDGIGKTMASRIVRAIEGEE